MFLLEGNEKHVLILVFRPSVKGIRVGQWATFHVEDVSQLFTFSEHAPCSKKFILCYIMYKDFPGYKQVAKGSWICFMALLEFANAMRWGSWSKSRNEIPLIYKNFLPYTDVAVKILHVPMKA